MSQVASLLMLATHRGSATRPMNTRACEDQHQVPPRHSSPRRRHPCQPLQGRALPHLPRCHSNPRRQWLQALRCCHNRDPISHPEAIAAAPAPLPTNPTCPQVPCCLPPSHQCLHPGLRLQQQGALLHMCGAACAWLRKFHSNFLRLCQSFLGTYAHKQASLTHTSRSRLTLKHEHSVCTLNMSIVNYNWFHCRRKIVKNDIGNLSGSP
jgi:hypothetical protein